MRSLFLAPMLGTLLIAAWLPAAPARAQDLGPVPEVWTVNVNLDRVPLRKAVEQVVQGSGYQYVVAAGLPDVPVTLKASQQTVEQALRLIVRKAAGKVTHLPLAREGEVFVVDRVPPERNLET